MHGQQNMTFNSLGLYIKSG